MPDLSLYGNTLSKVGQFLERINVGDQGMGVDNQQESPKVVFGPWIGIIFPTVLPCLYALFNTIFVYPKDAFTICLHQTGIKILDYGNELYATGDTITDRYQLYSWSYVQRR